MKEANDVVKARSKGDNMKLPGDYQSRFYIARKTHPHARVSFERTYPEQGFNVPSQPLSHIPHSYPSTVQ